MLGRGRNFNLPLPSRYVSQTKHLMSFHFLCIHDILEQSCMCKYDFRIRSFDQHTQRLIIVSVESVPDYKCSVNFHLMTRSSLLFFNNLVPITRMGVLRLESWPSFSVYNVCINVLILHLLGTGKSSIVCAMCLGLGGRPTLLGRAKEVCTAVGCVYLNAVDASLLSLSLSSPKNTSLFLLPLSLFLFLPFPHSSLLFSFLLMSLSLPSFPPSLPSLPLHTFVDQGFYQAWKARRVYRDRVVRTTREKPYH